MAEINLAYWRERGRQACIQGQPLLFDVKKGGRIISTMCQPASWTEADVFVRGKAYLEGYDAQVAVEGEHKA